MVPATINSIERIQLPDVRRPDKMPCLPAWVASRVESMKDERQPHPETGKHRTVPTLPLNLILGAPERDEIARHVRELDALCGPTPADDPEAEGAMLIVIAKMMAALPSVAQTEAGGEARGEAYLAALDDLPPWAVSSAMRKWHHGDCGKNNLGKPYDYKWPPAPAELRSIAEVELWRVKARATRLRDLLRAETLIEFSDEHRSAMLARLSTLMHETFGIPPVGLDDGSGGMVDASRSASADCGTSSTA
jgi:hypothetical protein